MTDRHLPTSILYMLQFHICICLAGANVNIWLVVSVCLVTHHVYTYKCMDLLVGWLSVCVCVCVVWLCGVVVVSWAQGPRS